MLNYENENQVLELFASFRVRRAVIEDYQADVRGMENLTRNQIKRKLFRNLLLAAEGVSNKESRRVFSYGNLFMVINDNKLIYLENFGSKPPGWVKDKVKYKELNRILGINY